MLEVDTKSGAEGNRTPVRKSIHCSFSHYSQSTMRGVTTLFPPSGADRQAPDFGSFIHLLSSQSFEDKGPRYFDAELLSRELLKVDSCH